MTAFADITVDPTGPAGWLFTGLIAGFLASRVLGRGGYGLLGDLVAGLAGGFIGGFAFAHYASTEPNAAGNILLAFAGACVLIALVRLVSPRRRGR